MDDQGIYFVYVHACSFRASNGAPGHCAVITNVSIGIFGIHTKRRGSQLWWENSSTSPLAEMAMWQGSKWEAWLWSLPQAVGIKDRTLKYQGADRACWLLSVIPAGAEPLGVQETSWDRAQVGKQTCLLHPCWGESLCLPLQAAGGSHRWSHPSSSRIWSYLFSQLVSALVTATQAEIYNPATGGCSQVSTVPLSISKEMSKRQNVKSFMFSTTKAEFSQSDACLRITKVHAEDWLGLSPTVSSLQSTASCHFQWENNLQNYVSWYCTKEHVPCC